MVSTHIPHNLNVWINGISLTWSCNKFCIALSPTPTAPNELVQGIGLVIGIPEFFVNEHFASPFTSYEGCHCECDVNAGVALTCEKLRIANVQHGKIA